MRDTVIQLYGLSDDDDECIDKIIDEIVAENLVDEVQELQASLAGQSEESASGEQNADRLS